MLVEANVFCVGVSLRDGDLDRFFGLLGENGGCRSSDGGDD